MILLFSLSCAEDDGGGSGGCATASYLLVDRLSSKSSTNTASEELVLEYVDADGKNLIANKTYNAGDISLDFEGTTRTGVVDFQNEDTRYLVYVSGFSEGKNLYSVNLSASETDTMEVYANEVDFSSCTGPVLAIDSVFYKGEKQNLQKVSDWLKKITILK